MASRAPWVLRCFVVPKGDQWIATCVDFDLVAQADTYDESLERLRRQIRSYLFDALEGEDKEHAVYLLSRRAPLGLVLKLKLTAFLARIDRGDGPTDRRRVFDIPAPVRIAAA